jgi:DNA-directed RNA polymerase specialized sigma24 family protein
MKLSHAIKVIENRMSCQDVGTEERVAMRVLVVMAKRILATRPSLRAVVTAVYGEDLNQTELADMFGDRE